MTLSDSLRRLSDEELAALLRARPDLAYPPPSDFGVLAHRSSSRVSISRALTSLDAFTGQVLEGLVVLTAHDDGAAGPVSYERLRAAADCDIRPAIDRLRALALIWGDDAALHPAGTVREVLGDYLAGLGRPARAFFVVPGDARRVMLTDPGLLRAAVAECDEPEREVLAMLAKGPAVGGLSAGLDQRGPIGRLVARGLLVQVGAQAVELPREVGLLLRGERPLGTVTPHPPTPDYPRLDPSVVDKTGAGQALEVLRLVDTLLRACASEPPAVLRTGGLGVRDLRRLARLLDVPEQTAGLLVEVAWAAGLLETTSGLDGEWLPSASYDGWVRRPPAQRWVRLAEAWLAMPREPALIGMRDQRDRPVTALSSEVGRAGAPQSRRRVLEVLATLPPGAAPAPAAVGALLSWHSPRLPYGETVGWYLGEAETLAVTGRGGLTTYGRALVTDTADAADAAGAAAGLLAGLLPEPVDHVLVQADLTIVVPGPLRQDLADELALVANLESAGGAGVYRVGPASVRRALDAGHSAADLHALFAARSRTPVPQALTYLIDDVARRHGGLRVGGASAYVRCDDAATLREALADRRLEQLRLRPIVPTVVVSSRPPAEVLQTLRAAGYAPVQESATGAVVVTRPEERRAPRRGGREEQLAYAGSPGRPVRVADEQRRQVVAGLRAADQAGRAAPPRPGPALPGVTTAGILFTLHQAARERRPLRLSYVDSHGMTRDQVLVPLSVGGGYLRAEDREHETLHTIALHRVSAALPDAIPDG